MALQFITADQRLARPSKATIALLGPSGGGKTFQARTLDPKDTLFVSLEAGDKALGDWRGTLIDVRKEAGNIGVHPWALCRAMACLLSGADPAASTDQGKTSYWYSAQALATYEGAVGMRSMFDDYNSVFWDSITVAARWSFAWAQMQPDAISEKTGKYNGMGAYGRHGQECVSWLTQIQHIDGKSTIVSGILDAVVDDFKRVTYEPQIEGGKTGRELPGIFDNVISMGKFKLDANTGQPVLDMVAGTERALVCQQINPWGLPAKDRSGCLNMLEAPDLGAVMRKIAAGNRIDKPITTLAQAQPAETVAA